MSLRSSAAACAPRARDSIETAVTGLQLACPVNNVVTKAAVRLVIDFMFGRCDKKRCYKGMFKKNGRLA